MQIKQVENDHRKWEDFSNMPKMSKYKLRAKES